MFIFLRFVLAHLIGDFPLQFDKIHALKHKSFLGNLPHICIIISCFIAMSFPYLDMREVWLFIIFIGATHLAQDWIKIKFGSKKGFAFISYILDQVLHIALISVVFLTDIVNIKPLLICGNSFYSIYTNDAYVLIAIFIIAITYNGHYMIMIFKKDYIDDKVSYGFFEKWYGMIERILIFIVFLLDPIWLITIPLIVLLRPILQLIYKDKLSVKKQFLNPLDISLSAGISIIAGVCIRQLLF